MPVPSRNSLCGEVTLIPLTLMIKKVARRRIIHQNKPAALQKDSGGRRIRDVWRLPARLDLGWSDAAASGPSCNGAGQA